MGELSTEHRNLLGRVILEARREGESGARKALEALAVARHEPHGSMSVDERALRNRLRGRGRQLGDVRDKVRGSQSVDRLVHEVAYEHWHRMLFARFLAESGLLIEPESGVAITLEECEELAHELGENPRALAARFAQQALPQIFRVGDPVLEVTLTSETQQALDKLLDGLPHEVFSADDSLGWTYQYWQSDAKDAVNASGTKVGADELPPVTQLFTEHYMVLFLLHNTIGAWHAGKVLAQRPELATSAANEDELRAAVALHTEAGRTPFGYLRFVRGSVDGDETGQPTGPWRPAAGTYDGWPKAAAELKVLDPCCGSGHFLVVAFKLLVRLRMHEERLELTSAIRAVLAENLFGLELDPRCTQIAAFNLALAAWKMAQGPIGLPALHVACSGLAVGASEQEWTQLADGDERLRVGMQRLYAIFEQAPELGSLIDPKAQAGDLLEADFTELEPLLRKALERDEDGIEQAERVVAAGEMTAAARLLANDYELVITNVPYLGRGQHSDVLKDYVDGRHRTARSDLATVFVDRMAGWLGPGGVAAAVTPQNWLSQPSYVAFRKAFLLEMQLQFQARLGARAFRTISGEVVNVALLSWARRDQEIADHIIGVDATASTGVDGKELALRSAPVLHVAQARLEADPDCRIRLVEPKSGVRLSTLATAPQGIKTGDDARYRRNWWELLGFDSRWRPFQGSPAQDGLYGGLHWAIDWGSEGKNFARLQGLSGWGRSGVVLRLMGEIRATIHCGAYFDSNVTVVLPKDPALTPAILAYCQHRTFRDALRELEHGIKFNNATTVKVPFDLDHWRAKARELFPHGLPEPHSHDPTAWLFHGHPAAVEHGVALQVATARLVGYRWPTEIDKTIPLAAEARHRVAQCDHLLGHADLDGIVCLSPTRGEADAESRLRGLLAAAFGAEWSVGLERDLLRAAAVGRTPVASLGAWLRDRFFEEHCKLFQNRPVVWHIWDGNPDGFHALVNCHRLTGSEGVGRRTLEALTYSYLGDWIERQEARQREGQEGADGLVAAAQDLEAQLKKILAGEPPYDLFVRWKPLHEQAIGWDPDLNDGVRLNIRPFMNAVLQVGGRKGAGILRWKPSIKWGKDRGSESEALSHEADFPWAWGCPGDGAADDRTDFMAAPEFDGKRWNDLHYSAQQKRGARARAESGVDG